MYGLFEINGPFNAVFGGPEGVQAELNPYSWHKKANMLYIDNPVGVGKMWINVHLTYPLLRV